MASKPYSPMQSPAEIAAKYGDKSKIGQAVQKGIIDPTVGMLAGMVIDRIRAPQPQGPQSTIAQKVMGLGATPQAQQMGMPPPTAPAPTPAAPAPVAPAQTMMAASGGLMDLPVDENMFDYAGGGVVAFDVGGSTGGLGFDLPMATGPDKKVLRAYYLSRGLPLPVELMTDDERAKVDPKFGLGPAGKKFGDLQKAEAGMGPASSIGELFGNIGRGISSLGTTDRRIDPVTGKEVTFGEFMRLEDARRAADARRNLPTTLATAMGQTPPAAAPAPAGDAATPAPRVEPKPPTAAPTAAPAPAAAPAAFQLPTPESPAAYKERMKEFGITDDWVKKAEASIEKLGGSAEDKERAIAMAIIRAGLGTAAGTSPNALLNLAQGALGGIEQYAKDTKDIRSAQRDAEKMRIEVAKAQDAQARGDFKGYNEHLNKANELAINLKKLEYDATRLGFEERRTAATEKQAAAYTEAARRPSNEIQLIERIAAEKKIPFSQAMKEVVGMKAEPKSRQQALKDWSDSIYLQRKYPKFDDYYATEVMGGAVGLPGVTFMGVRPAPQ